MATTDREWVALSKTARTRLFRVRYIADRDGYRCWYCEIPFYEYGEVTIEHEIPRSAGGTDALTNLRLACKPCNAAKGGIHGPKSYNPGMPAKPNHPVSLYPLNRRRELTA